MCQWGVGEVKSSELEIATVTLFGACFFHASSRRGITSDIVTVFIVVAACNCPLLFASHPGWEEAVETSLPI